MINCVVFAVPCFWRFQMQRALLGLLCGLCFVVASGCASHSTQDHANNKNKNDSGSSNVEVYGVIDAGMGHTRVRCVGMKSLRLFYWPVLLLLAGCHYSDSIYLAGASLPAWLVRLVSAL